MVLLQSVLAAVHLALVGLAAVGPLLVAGVRLPDRRRPDAQAVDAVLRRLARWSTSAVVAGAVVGLLAGCLRVGSGDNAYGAMLARFSRHAYSMLVVEWLFTLACYAAWLALRQRWHDKPWRHWAIALVGATNL